MPRKLDFGAEDMSHSSKAPNLPLKPTKRAPIDPSLARVATQQGRTAGFVRRETNPDEPRLQVPAALIQPENSGSPLRKRPGRPSREPQTRVSLSGPVRVIERFQRYCFENGDITYWKGLEQLLDEYEAEAGQET